MNLILAGLIDADFILPKGVHLNNVSFPMIKEHKLLTNSLSFCLSSCSLRLNTISWFAVSSRSLIYLDIRVPIDTLSLINISLFTFDSLLLSTTGIDFSWLDRC